MLGINCSLIIRHCHFCWWGEEGESILSSSISQFDRSPSAAKRGGGFLVAWCYSPCLDM